MSEAKANTTYTSPFDSGEWARWSDLERFNWLRAFRNGREARWEANIEYRTRY